MTLGRIVILFILFSISFAQTGTLKGRVVDNEGKLALPGAYIVVKETNFGAISDVNGYFSIFDLPSKEYTVSVSYIGYKSVEKTISITTGTNTLDFILEAGVESGNIVTVVGDRIKGQAKALNQQKMNVNITNIVASDQVGRFPDANIGDAMKRIPGLTVEYDQGEARFGLIRGTEARLNSVMINGERVPSAEGETRAVQLDLIPSDMVQNIEVNKAVTADMDADAIGGAVNLVTRSAPYAERISATLGSGYGFLREEPIMLGSAIYANRFVNGTLGVVASASYHNKTFGSDNMEAEWVENGSNVSINDFQIRKYDVQRVRQSGSLAFDYKLNNKHTLKLSSMYNHRDDWENRYRLRYKDIEQDGSGLQTEIRRQTKGGSSKGDADNSRLERQKTFTSSFAGDHVLGKNIKLNWSAAYSEASEERPNERYISWRQKKVPVTLDLSNPEKPIVKANSLDERYSDFSLKEITEENKWTEEKDINGRLDLEIPLNKGLHANSIKIGGRLRSKEKLRDNDFTEYEPTSGFNDMSTSALSDQSDADFQAGDYSAGKFTTKESLGLLDLNNTSLFDKKDVKDEYVAANYNATENIYAAYAMYNHHLNKSFFVSVGARIENTSIDYTGYKFDGDKTIQKIKGDKSYSDVLPSIHSRYKLNEETILRFAWTNTIARPNYYDLVPYKSENKDDSEVVSGNPELEATKSMNFDIMAERYFENVGIISAGVFYKDIKDFIFTYKTTGSYTFIGDAVASNSVEFEKPLNGGDAKLFGFEFAFQRKLSFLPGILKHLSMYTNYTYTNSEIDGLPIKNRESEDLALPGTAEHSLNGSLSFDNSRLSVRASVNYTSDFIEAGGISSSSFYDRYYDEVTRVDLNISYIINPQFRFFLEANNLTNQPLRFYQGTQDRTMQVEYYGRQFNAGIKFDL